MCHDKLINALVCMEQSGDFACVVTVIHHATSCMSP